MEDWGNISLIYLEHGDNIYCLNSLSCAAIAGQNRVLNSPTLAGLFLAFLHSGK